MEVRRLHLHCPPASQFASLTGYRHGQQLGQRGRFLSARNTTEQQDEPAEDGRTTRRTRSIIIPIQKHDGRKRRNQCILQETGRSKHYSVGWRWLLTASTTFPRTSFLCRCCAHPLRRRVSVDTFSERMRDSPLAHRNRCRLILRESRTTGIVCSRSRTRFSIAFPQSAVANNAL